MTNHSSSDNVPPTSDNSPRDASNKSAKNTKASEQPSSSSDSNFVLEIPPGVQLANTLFSFLAGYNYAVIEFFNENRVLDKAKVQMTIARTVKFCHQHPDTTSSGVLNVIVSSHYPRQILNNKEMAFKRSRERAWLWLGGSKPRPIAIVVCQDLPVEPTYYQWLLFAPRSSQALRNFLGQLVKTGQHEMVAMLRGVQLKEFKMLFEESLQAYPPHEQVIMRREYLESLKWDINHNVQNEADFKSLFEGIATQKIAQVLTGGRLGELVKTFDAEQLVELGEALSDSQLEEILARRRAADSQSQ